MYSRSSNKSGSVRNARNPDATGYYVNPEPQHQPVQPNGQISQHAPYHPSQQQEQAMHYDAQHQSFPGVGNPKTDEQSYAPYAPQNMSRATAPTPAQQNGFYNAPSYVGNHMQQDGHQFQQRSQSQFVPMDGYGNVGNASPPQTRLTSSYSSNFNPAVSPQSSPTTSHIHAPNIAPGMPDFGRTDPSSQAHHVPAQQSSSFYEMQQQQPYQPPPQQQMQQQQPQQQQPQQQQQFPGMQGAVPFMLSGMQQLGNGGAGGFNAALGAQLLGSFAPGAAGYTTQLFGQGQDGVRSFMRMPKVYFAVNHRYVLKKLYLILMPFTNRIWARQRGVDPGQFEGAGNDGVMYLPPREDVNAPDLYIPVMAFLTYVLMVGFVFGMRNNFQAQVLAKYFSKGLAVLSLEVLLIKLGLYLINARPTPWLDVIAYRGYKFVGVVLTMITGFVVPQVYIVALIYSATAMVIFLMRSHRRIILPRDADIQQGQDLARRNGFLLFVSVLQYPIYWMLVLDVRT